MVKFFHIALILKRNVEKILHLPLIIPILEKKFPIIRILGVKCGNNFVVDVMSA